MKDTHRALAFARWPLLFATAAVAGIGLYALAFGASHSQLEPGTVAVSSSSSAIPANPAQGAEGALVREVTLDELEAATGDYIACVERHGRSVSVSLPRQGLRRTQLIFHGTGDDGRPAEQMVVDHRVIDITCRTEAKLDEVGAAFALSQAPPSAAELESLFQAIRDCVAAGGRPDQEVPGIRLAFGYETTETIEVTPEQETAYFQCAYALWAETGLGPPALGGVP